MESEGCNSLEKSDSLQENVCSWELELLLSNTPESAAAQSCFWNMTCMSVDLGSSRRWSIFPLDQPKRDNHRASSVEQDSQLTE